MGNTKKIFIGMEQKAAEWLLRFISAPGGTCKIVLYFSNVISLLKRIK